MSMNGSAMASRTRASVFLMLLAPAFLWFSSVSALAGPGKSVAVDPACVAPPSGLVSWWTGDNSAIDIAGSYHGALHGDAGYAVGRVGRAFALDGAEGTYVEIAGSAGLNPAGAFSVDGWFYIDPAENFNEIGTLAAKSEGSTGNGWALYSDDRFGTKDLKFIVGANATMTNAIAAAGWYHVAGVYDPTAFPRARLYLDGSAVADSGASGAGPAPNDLPIRIGAMHWTDSYHQGNDRLRGLADEVEYFGRALTAAEVTAMYAAGASGKCRPCAAAPSGMLSWWPGEGNAGDVIGTNDGLPQGGATFAPGRTGQAFSFDGADDHVDIPDSPGIHFTAQQPMSIAFWVKRTSASPSQIILAKRPDCVTQVHYQLQWHEPSNTLTFSSTGGGANGVTGAATALPLDTWVYFSVTFDGTLATMYIDGAPVANHAMSFDPVATPLRLGGEPACGGQFFGGLIDELTLFDRALPAQEVSALYNACDAGICQPATVVVLAANLEPTAPGQTVVFTATVTGGFGSPTGTVDFVANGATPLCTAVPLGGGQAACGTDILPTGSHSIVAAYSGDGGHGAAASPPLAHSVSDVSNVLLTVAKGGTGGGAIASNPPGIECGGDCSEPYAAATAVTLTATADTGSVFSGWLGACTGRDPCNVVVGAATNVAATFAPAALAPLRIDIDGNGTGPPYDALTDGLMVIRHLFGLAGPSLTAGALGDNPARTDPAAIATYLTDILPILDVDGNGQADALTDGLMILRYLFGLQGNALIAGAIGDGATRTDAGQIETYIQSLMP
ncbi:MAG: Ig-like domain repeat protein [Burkholderiales bacterium]|nr:Ig-like domain repeat protein [Burkholderiales bacterium]